MSLVVEKYLLEPSTVYPLFVVGTRFSLGGTGPMVEDGYTVICAYAGRSYKDCESWEETAFHLLNLAKHSKHRIRDIYAIEPPNHGDSGIMNQDIIEEKYGDRWPRLGYTQSIHAFLTAGPSRGAGVDFHQRRLVAVGHCVGAVALSFLREIQPRVHIEALVALEPTFTPTISLPLLNDIVKRIQYLVWIQRRMLSGQMLANEVDKPLDNEVMDQEALEEYIKHVFNNDPVSRIAETHYLERLKLPVSKHQKSKMLQAPVFVVQAVDSFNLTAKQIPVHLIWGDADDKTTPLYLKHHVSRYIPASSVEYVHTSGEKIVQQEPELLAHMIHERLNKNASHSLRAAL